MREIPQCWLTGQAAGAAAALAADHGIEPAAVPIAELRSRLARQGVFLNPLAAEKPAGELDAKGLAGLLR